MNIQEEYNQLIHQYTSHFLPITEEHHLKGKTIVQMELIGGAVTLWLRDADGCDYIAEFVSYGDDGMVSSYLSDATVDFYTLACFEGAIPPEVIERVEELEHLLSEKKRKDTMIEDYTRFREELLRKGWIDS